MAGTGPAAWRTFLISSRTWSARRSARGLVKGAAVLVRGADQHPGHPVVGGGQRGGRGQARVNAQLGVLGEDVAARTTPDPPIDANDVITTAGARGCRCTRTTT